MLKEAVQCGILKVQYDAGSEEMRKVLSRQRNGFDVSRLEGKLGEFATLHKETNSGRQLQSITVAVGDLGHGPADPEKFAVPKEQQHHHFDISAQRFGIAAAPYLESFLGKLCSRWGKRKNTSILRIGVSWGRTVYSVVSKVSENSLTGFANIGKCDCIPLWGEPYGPEIEEWTSKVFTDRHELSSTSIAKRLHDVLSSDVAEKKCDDKQTRRAPRSLLGVPVVIPREMSGDAFRKTIEEYLGLTSAYQEIFVGNRGQKPLADELHMIVASAGSPNFPGRFLSPEVIRHCLADTEQSPGPELEKAVLESVYGDIAGVVFRKEKNKASSVEATKALDSLSQRWTGIKQRHLVSCAELARSGEGIGVVVFVIDKSRAEVVLEAIRMGVITHLVTDLSLARELDRLVTSQLQK
ncbi:MAG TPA: hypothetical protein PLY87_24035 [Planctomycetaceae bacterium]|nr:hypothetical protein [Planctomycetaceae bacterium]